MKLDRKHFFTKIIIKHTYFTGSLTAELLDQMANYILAQREAQPTSKPKGTISELESEDTQDSQTELLSPKAQPRQTQPNQPNQPAIPISMTAEELHGKI